MNQELKKILIRSREHLATTFQEPTRLAQISREAGYSPFHFHREFAALFGQSPAEYVREMRLSEAKRLLLRSDLHVTDICCEIGYASRTTFSREFARRHGQPPSEFRKVYAMPGLWQYKMIPSCFIANRKF